MPKATRRRKTRAARTDATAGPSSLAASASTPKVREKQVLPIFTALSSENPSDRLFACAGLANLLCDVDQPTRRLLGSHKIVDQMIARCNVTIETDSAVRAEAVGALRNLAVEGGTEVCSEMYNKGMLPVILEHLSLILSALPSDPVNGEDNTMTVEFDEDLEKRQSIVWDWTENLITLLWCLAEGSSKALPTLSSSKDLASFLMSILAHCVSESSNTTSQNAPLAVPLSALHLLSVLSDSNSSFVKTLLTISDLEPLLYYLRKVSAVASGKKQSQRHLLRILAISVLLNICTSSTSETSILNKKQKIMVQEIRIELNEKALWALILGLHRPANPAGIDTEKDTEDRFLDLQAILEVLGEFCNSLDGFAVAEEEAEEWNGIREEANGSVEQDNGMDEDENSVDGGLSMDGIEELAAEEDDSRAPPVQEIDSSTKDALIKSNLIPTLMQFAAHSPTTSDRIGNGSSIPTTNTAPLSTIQEAQLLVSQRALEALNNLLFTLARSPSSSPFLPAEILQSTWSSLFGLLVPLANKPQSTLFAPILGSIWALAQMCFAGGRSWIQMGNDEVPLLLSLIGGEVLEEAKIRCIGALGVLAARSGVAVEENRAIGNALLEPFRSLSPETPASLPLLVQALDSLFDIYADETRDYDEPVFKKEHFCESLQSVSPTFRILVKRIDKRKMPELRTRAEGALTNLGAFIEYRLSVA